MTRSRTYTLPSEWEVAVQSWCDWLKTGGASKNTMHLRRGHVRGTARRTGTQNPCEVTTDQLITLCAGNDWSNDHRRGLRISLNSFYLWAMTQGLVVTNPAEDLPLVPESKPRPRPAPDWLWEDLLASAAPRERLMIRLAGEAGLRRAEVAQVHSDDAIWDGVGHALIVKGKGDKQRTVPITDSLAEAIQRGPHEWIELPGGYLFPGQIDGMLAPNTVGKLVSDLMPRGWSIHKLRHRYATRGFAGTQNLRAVQEALGHASVATTQRYTAVTQIDVRAVTEAASQPVWKPR